MNPANSDTKSNEAARRYRERIKNQPAMTGQFTLPSGEVFTLRRSPLALWVQSGRVPSAFLSEAMKGEAEGESGEAAAMRAVARMGMDEVERLGHLLREAVCFICVEPRLYLDSDPDAPEDGLRLSELDPDDYVALVEELKKNCPSVPVALKGGEKVSVETLTTFRQKQPGQQPLRVAGVGGDGAAILTPA